MKAYANLNGKSQWSKFWADKAPKKIKKVFKKSARQAGKKQVTN